MTNSLIFISYSHKDKRWKNKLVTHLEVLKLEGYYELWEDTQISAGSEWYKKIEEAIKTAKVAILLVSADFLTSKFIRGKEVPPLLERKEKEGLCIFPVIIRPCAWDEIEWLTGLQARPEDGKPLSSKGKHQIETDLTAIAKEVKKIIQIAPEKIKRKNPEAIIRLEEKRLKTMQGTYKCKYCNGKGKTGDMFFGYKPCPVCGGAGEFSINVPQDCIIECKFCDGSGNIGDILNGDEPCSVCEGKGIIVRPSKNL